MIFSSRLSQSILSSDIGSWMAQRSASSVTFFSRRPAWWFRRSISICSWYASPLNSCNTQSVNRSTKLSGQYIWLYSPWLFSTRFVFSYIKDYYSVRLLDEAEGFVQYRPTGAGYEALNINTAGLWQSFHNRDYCSKKKIDKPARKWTVMLSARKNILCCIFKQKYKLYLELHNLLLDSFQVCAYRWHWIQFALQNIHPVKHTLCVRWETIVSEREKSLVHRESCLALSVILQSVWSESVWFTN